jgi:type IV pilus assembly protein PilP
MTRKILYIFIFISLAGLGCKDNAISDNKKKAAVPTKAVPAGSETVAVAQQDSPKVEKEVYIYDPKGRRDPFLSLIQPSKAKAERKKGGSPVENYDVDEVKLIAIAWDSQQYYAMITLPDRKSYTIRKGMTFGINDGKIADITRDAVYIKEQVKDYRGQFRTKDTILKLRKEEEE